MAKRSLRVILNGKKADLPAVRRAIGSVRDDGHRVDVRVTWEGGDAARFAAEALDDDVDVIVAAGGDGTVNEVVNGIFQVTENPKPAMGVMPLGSANDFSRGCGIAAGNPTRALRFAATGKAHPIDVARLNDGYFINSAVIGFGAEVTFRTSERMKKTIHGAAYGITGFLTALKGTVYSGIVKTPEETRKGSTLFAALSNGVQAGGFQLAPRAKLDDGLLDLFSVPNFGMEQIPVIMRDLRGLKRGVEPKFIRYEQLEWLEVTADREIPISPDGEILQVKKFRAEALKRRLRFVLPEGPLLSTK